MRPRILVTLLILLAGCTHWASGLKNQLPVPLGPLVAPEPIITPVSPIPIGLTTPAPFIVNPDLLSRPRPNSLSDEKPVLAPTSNREGEPECIPRRVPHRGGDDLHNKCADNVPQNSFVGSDVLLNEKSFDAMQLVARVAWEVKTDNYEGYTEGLREIVLKKQLAELRRERQLAESCGFGFAVGVRSKAHWAALTRADRSLNVFVMTWC